MPTAPLSRVESPHRQPAAVGEAVQKPCTHMSAPGTQSPQSALTAALTPVAAVSPIPSAARHQGAVKATSTVGAGEAATSVKHQGLAHAAKSAATSVGSSAATSSNASAHAPTHAPASGQVQAPLAPLNLPGVTVRTTKVVNTLGHEVAIQLLAPREGSHRQRREARAERGERVDRAAQALSEWVDSLCHVVLDIGLRSIAGSHPVLVEVSEDLLLSPLVEILDPRWAVIQLPEQLSATPIVRERLRELKGRGMVLSMSCNGATAARLQGITSHVQWVHLDIGQHDRSTLMAVWPDLSGQQVHLRGIDRLDDFREYRTLGVHAFSGPLLSAPVSWSADQLPACDASAVRHAWERLLLGADDAELAGLIECDPALTLRLLILACDGLQGAACRPESILDLVSRLRGPALPIWLELLHHDAKAHESSQRMNWSEAGAHLSLFMRLLIERLAPDRRDLQGQAALLGLVAHYRHTMPARMVGQLATPLMCPAIEDAWIHRQCLLGAVLDIGLRLMFNGQPMAPVNGIIELYEEAGRLVRERRAARAVDHDATTDLTG